MARPWWRKPSIVIASGCAIAIVTFGVRTSFGLFTAPLADLHGWDRETFALAIAVQNLLWLSTVPLTSGLVALMFGTRHVGLLFGVVFLSHQIGAFLGALLGGAIYDRTGGYDLMWVLCIALSAGAAVVHLPIHERRAPQPSLA